MKKDLDLRGLSCPEPVLRTKKIIDDAGISSIEILVDDEVNVQNLVRLARAHKLSSTSQASGNHFCVSMSRDLDGQSSSGTSTTSSADSKSATAPTKDPTKDQIKDQIKEPVSARRGGGTIVFLAKDTFGQGASDDKDHDFSHNLINVFLQTVQQSALKPRAVLLANSGVKLIDPDAATYKVLQDLKEDGVTVLACGLCLDYYNLKAKVPIEQITNMFAICEYLFAADLVVNP